MTKRFSWALRTSLALALSGMSAGAWADAGSQAAAETLFRQGRELMQQGRFAEACAKLSESQRLDPGAGTLLNLAACYEKNGQTASAWVTYTEAASFAARGGRADWEATARDRASQLEPTLSTLTIVVPPASDVVGLVVERSGVKVERAQWGLPIPVDPGVHPVGALAPEKQQWSTTVAVGPNAAKATVTIPPLLVEQGGEPQPVVAPADVGTRPLQTDAGVDDGDDQRTWGLVVGGVGVVGLGAGAVFGLMAKSKHDEALEHCNGPQHCTSEAVDLDDQARSRATVSTILVGVGAAAMVGGAVLYFTTPAKEAGDVAWTAAPTAGGAAFAMQGVW